MSDTTTPAATDSGDAGQDYRAKYDGAQRVINRKHEELTAAQAALEAERTRAVELESELAAYRAKDAEARQNEQDRATYESLRDRFEPDPPTPRGNNPAREPRTSRTEDDIFAALPRGKGFPTD